MSKVRPFSNGTEFMYWDDYNCSDCIHCNDRTKHINETKTKCLLELSIALASVSDGEVPLFHALLAGWDGERMGKCPRKPLVYAEFNTQYMREMKNQLKLF